MNRYFSALAISVLALSTATVMAYPNGKPWMTATEKQNGKQVRVPLGSNLDVSLAIQPGTGFEWQVDKTPACLKLTGKSELTGKGRMPGGKQHVVFHFLAASAGSGTLKLKLVRSFEASKAPAKTFTLQVGASRPKKPARRHAG
ncbi:MAG: protease inhibitor I42 family protein [Fimbriimonas ginsengisoli]|uniref:Protease inhibitor I42 family protein n=1 Tax=Fimbriimonas ginsengisoli TaxID=1005039 RepID=A0A931LRZ1_FIMGI|nr:protease inhibitor I42 family protein [Fimbriimonas ginsengisoli]